MSSDSRLLLHRRARRSWTISVDERGEKWPSPESKPPRHPVEVVPLDDAEPLALALEGISDLRKTWPNAAQALADWRSHHLRKDSQ